MKKIKVLLADDHAVVRDGLSALLGATENIEVAGKAVDGREAVKLAEQLTPDIVVMDISMPGLNGIEATRQIRHNLPLTRVIILSMHDDKENIFQAMEAGAEGYLLKESAGVEVVDAVREVMDGRRYLSRRISDQIVQESLQPVRKSNAWKSPIEKLSNREREILQLVAEGKTSAEVADILFISPKTVETYRSRLMVKLGLRDLPSLVRFAIKHGITPLD
jgi:DNA-binding NarL/FixJ family response regulator